MPRGKKIISPDGMAWCSDCNNFLHLDKFYVNSKTGKAFSYCRECRRARERVRKRRSRGLADDAVLKPGTPKDPGHRYKHSRSGYIMLKVGYDKSCHHRADKWGYVPEHIIVAEEKYGIDVTRDYTIHHKNGVRDDNRLENLELRAGPHGKGANIGHVLVLDDEVRAQVIDALIGMGYDVRKTCDVGLAE